MKIGRKNKNKEYSFDPNSFLSGTHDFDPIGAMKSWWDDEDEDEHAEGDFEGKEIAEMNAVLAAPKSSPPISKTGSLLSAEGESPLDQTGREYMGRREVEEDFAAMENPPGDSIGDKLGSYLGQAGDYVGGLFSPEEKEYRDVADTEGENRYLNKLAGEEYRKKRILGPHGMDGNQREPTVDGEGESELDRIGRENMINAMGDLGPDKMEKPGESIDQTSIFDGLFSSDDDKKKHKPFSKGKQAGIKIATDLLTGSNRNTPVQNAPSAGVKMGRASFPGLLAASQRPVNPRYTPKGLG